MAVPLAFIDAREQRLPDLLTLPSYPAVPLLLGAAALAMRGGAARFGHAVAGMAVAAAYRKVELGVCTRDFGTPCVHEHACIHCPALRLDPAQRHRLADMDQMAARHQVTHLGMPDFRPSVGRSSGAAGGP